jgi:hypothetical protein
MAAATGRFCVLSAQQQSADVSEWQQSPDVMNENVHAFCNTDVSGSLSLDPKSVTSPTYVCILLIPTGQLLRCDTTRCSATPRLGGDVAGRESVYNSLRTCSLAYRTAKEKVNHARQEWVNSSFSRRRRPRLMFSPGTATMDNIARSATFAPRPYFTRLK